ncbi:glycoside hydrolase family 16 protein [Durotheca rogersii]|uniref:glycoside hydrolase family 16 protein n=1 Tax=Durotheca rogersii TaxID=419775 RepID=UPI002220594D|nr:glycoside hydrolase family 16 protein [Durotheca rogersii]KAI5865580.1 glycoside hydrolase family 16 protein [Durotheca rogersii]
MGWEDTAALPKAGPATTFEVRDANGPVNFVTHPSPYHHLKLSGDDINMASDGADGPWWNPRYWRKRTWAIVVGVLVAIIIVAVVTPIEVAKRNRYPDYYRIDYALADEYSGTTFFDQFNYFVGYDPAQGFVHYVPREQATQLNLTYASADAAILRVDTSVGPGSEPDASTGRFSVRLESKRQYDTGLFVFDVRHTPFGCGTWPALWLADPVHWPDNGEIDVLEAVNRADTGNQMTLHTTAGCTVDARRIMTGESLATDCHNATDNNAGCGVRGPVDSYGTAFNAGGGGVAAVEWRAEGIRIWQFPRDSIPADIAARRPDPSAWGSASADFPNTNCDVGAYFRNQSIIVNIDLCGQYAGSVYSQSGCPSNCTDFVANNPQAFTDAFWELGAFEVYQRA